MEATTKQQKYHHVLYAMKIRFKIKRVICDERQRE